MMCNVSVKGSMQTRESGELISFLTSCFVHTAYNSAAIMQHEGAERKSSRHTKQSNKTLKGLFNVALCFYCNVLAVKWV